MRLYKCPYLGLRSDPKTALNFPSEGNCCYHARPVASVDRTHQAQYCLTEQHVTCPVYARVSLKPLPYSLVSAQERSNRAKRVLAIAAVPFIVAGTVALATLVSRSNIAAALLSRLTPSPQTSTDPQIPVSGLFGLQTQITRTPYQPFTVTVNAQRRNPNPGLGTCTIPEGWTPYVVKPTDSLFRLSVLYGISIQTLQEANCLGDQSVVLPGDIIYIPEPITNSPTETPQPTNTRFFRPSTSTTAAPPNLQPPDQRNAVSSTATPTSTQRSPTIPRPSDTKVPSPTTAPTQAIPTLAPTSVPPSPVPTNTTRPTARPTRQPPTPRPTNTTQPSATQRPTDPPTAAPTTPTTVPPTATNPPATATDVPPTATNEPPIPTDPPPTPTEFVEPTIPIEPTIIIDPTDSTEPTFPLPPTETDLPEATVPPAVTPSTAPDPEDPDPPPSPIPPISTLTEPVNPTQTDPPPTASTDPPQSTNPPSITPGDPPTTVPPL